VTLLTDVLTGLRAAAIPIVSPPTKRLTLPLRAVFPFPNKS
jgi:hypothetical protein